MRSAPLLLLAAAICGCDAHSTKYPHVDAMRKELRTKYQEDDEPPAILSWHVHITYFLTSDDHIQQALDLRQKTADHFAPYLGEECDGRYDYGYLCMINDHNFENETLKVRTCVCFFDSVFFLIVRDFCENSLLLSS